MKAANNITVNLFIKGACVVNITLSFHIAPAAVTPTAGKTDFSGQVGQPFTDDAQLAPSGTTLNVPDPSQIPPGLTINTDGSISGTPTQEGDFAVQAELN